MDPFQPTLHTEEEWPLLRKGQLGDLLNREALAPGAETSALPPSPKTELKDWLQNGSIPPAPQVSPTPPPFTAVAVPSSLQPSPLQPPSFSPQMTQIPQGLVAVLPTLIHLIQKICAELSRNPHILLSLNRTRREALVQHLSRLAGVPASTSDDGLRQWVEGVLGPSQTEALRVYREEIALICIGQAMLLKAWSDKGHRPLGHADLGRLNFALSGALRPHLPLHREGCLITRPNLYSWFNPSTGLQREIWSLLESWPLGDEGPSILAATLALCRKAPSEGSEPKTFDSRFFRRIWESVKQFGIDLERPAPGPIPRKRVFFSPTLRDGSLLQTGPEQAQWIGLETDPFRLLSAELTYLWWGPTASPLWDVGTGLEVHAREQLALEWNTAKPSIHSQIAEMEACDLAFVLEERCVRLHQKSVPALRFRQQVDTLGYYKKLRSPETSLGALQACVALSKLRPGGLLWWAREEPLSPREGHEALRFLLDRARLVCEWDLSAVTHSLPTQQPLFSRYLYLLERDPEVERRRSHRPLSVKVSGSIRSHVELPLFLNDILNSGKEGVSARGQWETARHQSPTPQQEWPDHWPNSASQESLRKLERLRENSVPVGQLATVRTLTAGQLSDPAAGLGITDADQSSSFIVIQTDVGAATGDTGHSRILTLSTLDRGVGDGCENGFLIGLSNPDWVAPIRAFLESQSIREWLDCHAEKKNLRWVLKESTVKYLPIPKSLLAYLSVRAKSGTPDASVAGLLKDMDSNPAAAADSLRRMLAQSPEASGLLRTAAFAEAAIIRHRLAESQKSLLTLVRPNGQMDWRGLLQVVPKTGCIQFGLHSSVRLVGSLAKHLPIDRIQRVHSPAPGIVFATEAGFRLEARVDDPFLLDLLYDQVKDLRHSTWAELSSSILLPRDPELLRSTATDILKSHSREHARLVELGKILEMVLPTA